MINESVYEEAHMYKVIDEASEMVDEVGIVRFLEMLKLKNPQQDVLVGRVIDHIEKNWNELTKEVYI